MNIKTDWITKLSDQKDVEFVALISGHDLTLQLYVWAWSWEGCEDYYCFSWKNYAAYNNTNELQLQAKVFEVKPLVDYASRWTFYVEDSKWVEESRNTPLFTDGLKHYVIFTVTNTINILSKEEPTISAVSIEEVNNKGLRKQTAVNVQYKDKDGKVHELPK